MVGLRGEGVGVRVINGFIYIYLVPTFLGNSGVPQCWSCVRSVSGTGQSSALYMSVKRSGCIVYGGTSCR